MQRAKQMKIEDVRFYVAKDGQKFTDKQQCLDYEEALDVVEYLKSKGYKIDNAMLIAIGNIVDHFILTPKFKL